MAFTVTSRTGQLVKNVGIVQSPKQYVGVTTLAGGVGTISIPGARRVVAAFVSAQTTTACSISATSTNTFSITGGTTDVIMWLAYVE